MDTRNGKKNIQAFLQDTFLAATEKLVKAVGDLDTVLGFEVSIDGCEVQRSKVDNRCGTSRIRDTSA